MKRSSTSTVKCALRVVCTAVALCAVTLVALGQDSQQDAEQPMAVQPGTALRALYHVPGLAPPAGLASATAPAAPGAALPTWSANILAGDAKTYTVTMVGTRPSNVAGATTIPTVLIPVRLNFAYSKSNVFVFDPTAGDPGCIGAGNTAISLTQNGPTYKNFDYNFAGPTNVGTSQYTDAFQRASFWNAANGFTGVSGNPNYHTLLSLRVARVQTVTVPSADSGTPSGTVYSFALPPPFPNLLCGTNTGKVNQTQLLGVMDFSFWDPVAQSLVTKLGISPGTLAIFLFYNAALSIGNPTNTANCCALGYHFAFGQPAHTYVVAEFDGRAFGSLFPAADITALSHEVGEWLDDPFVANTVPGWINPGGVCQHDLEVGDPLNGNVFAVPMPNGFTYHPQELAFAWWFLRTTSNGVNGWFSGGPSFTTDAGPVCQ